MVIAVTTNYNNRQPVYDCKGRGLESATRHDQHLRLCRHGRQLSEQCLHRKEECGHSLRDAGRGTGSPQASAIQGCEPLPLHQGLLCNGRH